jgi:ABC-type spermidine/putrescine transport system permease subunit II
MYVAPFVWLAVQSISVDGRFSVDYWVTSWTSDSSLAAVALKSLALAACVGVVASTVGALAAIAATDMRLRKWSRVVLAPMLFTSATMGLGMLLSYTRSPFEWERAAAPLVIAQSLLVLPISYATIVSRMDEADDSMQVVAQSLGASASRAFFTAYGSRLFTGALSAAGLCAAIACGEYGAASFLSDFQTPTLSVFLMRQLGRPGEASMAIASVIAISLSAIAMLLLGGFERLSKAAEKVRR